jgi:hypothetical protein
MAVRMNNDISDYYYPITGKLIGKAHPRTTVDPVIAPPIYAHSDADNFMNTDRPNYLIGDGTYSKPLDTQTRRGVNMEHVYEKLQVPRDPYTSQVGSDQHVHSVMFEPYAQSRESRSTQPAYHTTMPTTPTSPTTPYQPLPGFKDAPIWGYGIGQTKPPVTLQTEPVYIHKQSHTSVDSVYDPRTFGFGDERRYRLDPINGNPDWNYDDIDAARIPQYITRSDVDMVIDTNGYASPSLGLGQVQKHMDASFIDQTNQSRTEYMEGYMRKYREQREWQYRDMPVNRMF